jgi:site-specific DNA-methyltransferase (adenine-specific)
MTYQLWQGDCLEEMSRIEDGSVDMILADLPYGDVTACEWDKMIPFEPLWTQYKRIIKKRGAVILFGNEPFSSLLRLSNLDWYKYDWVWDKVVPSGMSYARFQPMRQHENILVFGKSSITYNPQMIEREKPIKEGGKKPSQSAPIKYFSSMGGKVYTHKFPSTIIRFLKVRKGSLHPTQKPVCLLDMLIKTFSNPGELVLDNTCGSGSTLEAAELNGRNSIGIEKDAGYFEIARNRLEQVTKRLSNQDLPMFSIEMIQKELS